MDTQNLSNICYREDEENLSQSVEKQDQELKVTSRKINLSLVPISVDMGRYRRFPADAMF